MPLQAGRSKKTVQKNIRELISSKPSATRAKGIKTLARNMGLSMSEAKRKQAVAIAFAKSRKG